MIKSTVFKSSHLRETPTGNQGKPIFFPEDIRTAQETIVLLIFIPKNVILLKEAVSSDFTKDFA